MRDRRNGHAPVRAVLRDRSRHRTVRARLIPVTVRARAAEQPVDQDPRACPLVALDHDAGRVGERGADSVFGADTLETPVALAEYDALHAPPSRHEFEPIT